MSKKVTKTATKVSRGQNNLINSITKWGMYRFMDIRLGIIKVDEAKAMNFGYGGE